MRGGFYPGGPYFNPMHHQPPESLVPVTDFELICTSNPHMNLTAIIEEENRRLIIQEQEKDKTIQQQQQAQDSKQTEDESTIDEAAGGKKRKVRISDPKEAQRLQEQQARLQMEKINSKRQDTIDTIDFLAGSTSGAAAKKGSEFQRPQDRNKPLGGAGQSSLVRMPEKKQV